MDKMNLFGGNAGAKSSEASFEGNDKSSEVSPNPIQDENGILRFRLNISEITPVSSNHVTTRNIDDDGCFNLKGCICALNVNSEEEREKVKEEVNAITLAKYDWFKETTGDRHWVLYNTKMYEVSLGHDATAVARAFRDVLVKHRSFNQIVFAIPECDGGSDSNFQRFESVFSHFAIGRKKVVV